jgi:hypothetical protein
MKLTFLRSERGVNITVLPWYTAGTTRAHVADISEEVLDLLEAVVGLCYCDICLSNSPEI